MLEEKSSTPRTTKKGGGTWLSSHSGTLLLFGLILIGFLVAWWHGGFPSILLPSFLLLAIGMPIDLLNMICKSAPKKEPKPVNPLRGIFIIVIFYLIFAWMSEALLPLLQGPNLNKILHKVEFPFSEASHVVADSEGSVYVYSQFNKRIQKYNKDGRFQFGWFASNCKNASVAIDEKDFIYTHAVLSLRKYDNSGNLIDEISMEPEGNGWWRFGGKSVTWDPNAEKPRRYDLYDKDPIRYGDVYNTAVKEGDLMPAFELRKSGFKTADARYYKLTRLWFMFPVVSVDRYLSKFERYVLPNPVSLPFTFVFPGFLFYAFALFLAWVLEKPTERLTKPFLLEVAVAVLVLVIAFAGIVIGSKLVMVIANDLPASNPLHFWLVPLVVIPYWIIVIIVAYWLLRATHRFLCKSKPADSNEDSQ